MFELLKKNCDVARQTGGTRKVAHAPGWESQKKLDKEYCAGLEIPHNEFFSNPEGPPHSRTMTDRRTAPFHCRQLTWARVVKIWGDGGLRTSERVRQCWCKSAAADAAKRVASSGKQQTNQAPFVPACRSGDKASREMRQLAIACMEKRQTSAPVLARRR